MRLNNPAAPDKANIPQMVMAGVGAILYTVRTSDDTQMLVHQSQVIK
jgi:hypothetical protein